MWFTNVAPNFISCKNDYAKCKNSAWTSRLTFKTVKIN